MTSCAPASSAPPDFSSFGIIVSQSERIASYCLAAKYLGVYFPAGAAAFSLCTIWCASSAASSGITCSAEPPAAPSASVFNTSLREIPCVAIFPPLVSVFLCALQVCVALLFSSQLQSSFSRFIQQIFRSPPGKRHDRERRIFVRVRHQRRSIGHENVFHIMRLAISIEHARFWFGAHARGADFVNDFPSRQNPKRIRAVNARFRL